MKYEYIDDLTSDVLFHAYGRNLKEVFENSALAMFEIICDTKQVQPINVIEVKVSGKDSEDLLYNWLQELIALVDIEEAFFSKFDITKITNTELTAKIYGESMTKEKGYTVVKAVTYYKFNLEKIENKYKSTVSLDI